MVCSCAVAQCSVAQDNPGLNHVLLHGWAGCSSSFSCIQEDQGTVIGTSATLNTTLELNTGNICFVNCI